MNKNKPIALITGASTGIGAEFARVFATEGYDLILVARSTDKLEQLAEELRQAHATQSTVISSDLSKAGAAAALFDEVNAEKLEVEVLVNNAGILHRGRFMETDVDAHLQLVNLNVAACTALAHLFLKPMLARGSGRILNIVSTSSFQPLPNLATYAASKAYMRALSEALSVETKGTGVTVTALCPGFVNTDMIAREGQKKPMNVPFIRNLNADEVARQGFAACMAGKPVYVNGLGNRAIVTVNQLQPGPIRRWATLQLSRMGF